MRSGFADQSEYDRAMNDYIHRSIFGYRSHFDSEAFRGRLERFKERIPILKTFVLRINFLIPHGENCEVYRENDSVMGILRFRMYRKSLLDDLWDSYLYDLEHTKNY